MKSVFRVSFRVSLGLIYGFFRVHLGFHVGFLIRSSYQDFFKVSLGFTYIGCLQTGESKAKEKKKQRCSKDRKQRSKGAGSRATKTHA